MPFLPREFTIPTLLETDRFRMRPLSIHDIVKDYDAVMTSREHLWKMFGEIWGWPAETLTLEQDLIDLAWHYKEFQLRRAFAYSVMSPDESRLLGCVYVDPPGSEGYDAEVYLWVRSSELETGLEEFLHSTVKQWIATNWPFERVAYPGRERGNDEL